MNRAEFEASLRQEGYEVREGEIEPHRHLEAHAHDFDVRILVLDGPGRRSWRHAENADIRSTHHLALGL